MVNQPDNDILRNRVRFTTRVLPWLVGAMALVLYLVTLNPWITSRSLSMANEVSGFSWTPELKAPVAYLVTQPIKLLPQAWRPTALNAFSAVLAALSLALLARCVALLPHDRTHRQRMREPGEHALLSLKGNWGPPVLAVLLCGLQRSFWEQATTGLGEMLDLFLFAVVTHQILAFRITRRMRMLCVAAALSGMVAVNHWLMPLFLPFIVLGLLWALSDDLYASYQELLARVLGKGTNDNNLLWRKPLARLLALGFCFLGGCSFQLLLPFLAWMRSPEYHFIAVLKAGLSAQAGSLLSVPAYAYIIMLLTCAAPLVLLLIRWPAAIHDPSRRRRLVQHFLFYAYQVWFLATTVAAAFDCRLSPRWLQDQLAAKSGFDGHGSAMLPFYFMAAMTAGYSFAYFQLLFGRESARVRRAKSPLSGSGAARRPLVLGSGGALVVLAGLLVWQNGPYIQFANSRWLQNFTQAWVDALPREGAVLISDDPSPADLLEFRLHETHRDKHILVQTGFLQLDLYQQHLERWFPKSLPGSLRPATAKPGSPDRQLAWLANLTAAGPVQYLHYSFGHYFETLDLKPHGMLIQLQLGDTNNLGSPSFPPGLLEQNIKAWKALKPELDAVSTGVRLGVKDARLLARHCSRLLNYFAVTLQRAGRWDEAAPWLNSALELNAKNVVAALNLDYNRTHRGLARRRSFLDLRDSYLGQGPDYARLLFNFGPIDEPFSSFVMADLCLRNGLPRQALVSARRATELEPDDFDIQTSFVEACWRAMRHDEGLRALADLEAGASAARWTPSHRSRLVLLKARGMVLRRELQEAENLLSRDVQSNPDPDVLMMLGQLYLLTNRATNAPNIFERVLETRPNHLPALLGLGSALLLNQDHAKSIAMLNKALTVQPKHRTALALRAMAYSNSAQWELAGRDYESLIAISPNYGGAYVGLAKVAQARHDDAGLKKNCHLVLQHTPTDSEDAQWARHILKDFENKR